jgi:hypothetical protein
MKPNHIPLTQTQLDTICYPAGWQIEELSFTCLHQIPKMIRADQLLGGFVSGCRSQPKVLNGFSSIAGMDILRYEPHPQWSKGEWHLNVYHYVIQETTHPSFPYLLHGPFRNETIIGHWPKDLNLIAYGNLG